MISFIIVVICCFYFIGRISKLERRFDLLEGNKENAVSNVSAEDSVFQEPKLNMHEEVPVNLSDIPPPSAPLELSSIEKLFKWIKEDFMVKVGALLLILAFGWFVTYAIAEQWIGPMGQITIGLLAGTAFLCLGVWRIGSHGHQGGIFTVLGSTIVLLVMFAAREVYGFFTPTSSLFVMFMSVAFVAFVSVKYKRENLAYSGVVLASIAPLLAGVNNSSSVDLFTYLLVVTAGSLWVVWLTGWTKMILVSLVVTYLYSITFIMNGLSSERDIVLMFSFIFVSIYFVANIVSLIRRRIEVDKHLAAHTLTALGTVVFLFTWVEYAMSPEWKSMMYVSWSLIFAIGVYFVYLYTANKVAFYLYGAVSAALVGIATAAELDGSVLTLAYFLEVCLVIFAAGKLRLSSKTLSNLSLLLAVPISLSLPSLNLRLWSDGIMNEHFVIVCVAMLVLFSVGLFLRTKRDQEEDSYVELMSSMLLIGSLTYGVSLVWLSLHSLLSDDFATMLSLFIYTVVGISMFVLGTVRSQGHIKVIGGLLVAMVVARLLLIEVWDMELAGRIVTFLVVGVMLMSTAFIRKIHPSNENSDIN